MKKRKKKVKKNKLKIIIPIILLIIIVFSYLKYTEIEQKNKEKLLEEKKQDISLHYNNYVITNKNAILYQKDNNTYKKVGKISKNQELVLKDTKIDANKTYFELITFDNNYYIYYKDVNKIDKLTEVSDRYKKYIPFNENIITKDITKFYDSEDKLIYTINKSFDLPIIIKDTEKYGIEYNSRLLYVKKEDVKSTKENKNTDKSNTSYISALNYHFFWDDEKEPQSVCNQEICHSKSQFKSHLDLFKSLDILTLKMNEVEMYIDGKIQLPKSVVITIDDGWMAALGIEILNEYKMYGTAFLITGSYEAENYRSEYVELHSHTNHMHDPGKCPGGQGGGIKCLPRDEILTDLKKSREALWGSTVFCYPFYEYNDYAISLLKEAGFTMAFAGDSYGDDHIRVGSNKYTLPRFVVVSYTTLNDLKNFVS